MPTKITVLKSEIRPDECGDTEFSDTTRVYEELSDELKAQLSGLEGRYCYLKLREVNEKGSSENLAAEEVKSATNCAIHPIATTHPITGYRNLYANPSHTASIVGYNAEESEALLQTLFNITAQQKYIYRHTYKDGDVILWDNRAVHHRATGCPDDYPRKLIRTTVENDEVPKEIITVAKPFDLSQDRLNSEYYAA